jgi:hypothetical protein
MVISRSVLRTSDVSDKIYRENQNAISCSIIFFSENPAVYEIMWKNMVEPDRPQVAM